MDWLLRLLNCCLGIDERAADQLRVLAQGYAGAPSGTHLAGTVLHVESIEAIGSQLDGSSEPGASARLIGAAIGAAVDTRINRGGSRVNGRAIVPLTGVLVDSNPWYGETSYESFAMRFLAAIDDPEVSEVIIAVNSPGGMMAGAAETSDVVFRARGRKPITAVGVNGYMASAAYLVASAADKVYSTVSAFSGSIGVVMIHIEMARALDKAGFGATVLRMPDKKAIGNDVEVLTKEAYDLLMREDIEPAYRLFVERVARNRGISAEAVREKYGQGLALIASRALEVGLIDRVIDWQEFVGGQKQVGQVGRVGQVGQNQSDTEVAVMKFSAKLKALLFGLGIVPAVDATDEVCTIACQAWFAARGQALPSDEAAIEAAVKTPASGQGSAVQGSGNAQPDAAAVQAAVQTALQADRQRRADIQARATLLGVAAGSALLTAALDGNQTPDQFAAAVATDAVANNRPLQATRQITPGASSHDTFCRAAIDALLLRSQGTLLAIGAAQNRGAAGRDAAQDAIRQLVQDNGTVRQIAGMHWREIMATAVETRGVRLRERDDLSLAQEFLRLTGRDAHLFARGNGRYAGSDLLGMDVAQGVSDYPNILDGLAQRVVMIATRLAPVTYDRVCRRLSDMPNFSPREFVTLGYFGELPVHIDNREYAQADVLPTEASWILADEYGVEFGLTPRMAMQDPTDILVQRLSDMQIAHEKTVNRLYINLLTGNVLSPVDGVACYSHDNDVSDGGAPSVDQTKAMRKLMNKQKYMNDTEEAGIDLAMVLTGSEWLTDAAIVYTSVNGVQVVYTKEDDVNPFRGLVPMYDPMLSGIGTGETQGFQWYGAADPAIFPGIYVAFVQGFGPGGRRETYYCPEKEAQVFRIKGAFGAALRHHAAFVRNSGVGLV